METLLAQYGLPTALLIATGTYISLLVKFLKELITGNLQAVIANQEKMAKELRTVQDDLARIELMLRLTNDIRERGRLGIEMSRIGKANTDVQLGSDETAL